MLGSPFELDAEPFGHEMTEAFEVTPWQTLLAVYSVPAWMPFPGRRRLKRARAALARETSRTLKNRLLRPASRPNLLDALLAARDPASGEPMRDADVVDNLLTFTSCRSQRSSGSGLL